MYKDVFADVLRKLIDWNDDSLKRHLPLPADTSVDVSLTVFGLSDFILSHPLSRMSYFVSILFSVAQHSITMLYATPNMLLNT